MPRWEMNRGNEFVSSIYSKAQEALCSPMSLEREKRIIDLTTVRIRVRVRSMFTYNVII